VEGDKDIGLAGADAESKGGWLKDGMECGVDTVGESETLCALSGGFSASLLRTIASHGTRPAGAGASRTVGVWTSCWDTLDIVRGRSRWFVWSASRTGSNVCIGYGQSWNKSSILQTTWPMRRRCITQRAHILDRWTLCSAGQRARREAGKVPSGSPGLHHTALAPTIDHSTLHSFSLSLPTPPEVFPHTRPPASAFNAHPPSQSPPALQLRHPALPLISVYIPCRALHT